MASPPKPWERRAAEARASSSSFTATGSAPTTVTGISASGGTSASALAASSAVPAVSSSVPTASTTSNGLQPAPYQHYGSSYDSSYPSHGAGSMFNNGSIYGSSLYGGNGSMYGNSMYGGSSSMYGGGSSMYGSSMYGGGGSMYGGGYGNRQFGYGLNPLQKTPGAPFTNALVHNGQNFIEGVHQHVSTFGRFSQILQMNFEALHMSFSSLLQLLSNVSMLRQEFGAIFSTFGGLRALYVIFLKARSFVLRALGMPSAADRHEMGKVWSEVKNSNWGWFPILLTASCFAWLIKRLFALLTNKKAARTRSLYSVPNNDLMSQASSQSSSSPDMAHGQSISNGSPPLYEGSTPSFAAQSGHAFTQQSPFQQYYDQNSAFENQWAE